MKKVILVIMGLCALALPALAFHDAGVAHCNGCHTMHNSEDGQPVDPSPIGNGGNPYLLNDSTPSDVCLNCHATHYGSVFQEPGVDDGDGNFFREQGGGNFWWLTVANLNDGHNGALHPISGDAAGHNLFAPGHMLATDGVLTQSPGGTFPANVLGCSSCHDPHGTNAFRLLYGAGRTVQAGIATFTNDAPDATGLSLFFGTESNTSHTAYQDGMSAWCGNCHGDFHAQWNATLVHPSGQLIPGGQIAAAYNSYLGTADLLTNGVVNGSGHLVGSGDYLTAYLAQVPVEDPAFLTTNSQLGVSGTTKIMCLTCHRAHASEGPDAGRWDFNITVVGDDGLEGAPVSPDPYGDPEQRSLCNKCHLKDWDDYHSVANP